MEHYTNINAMVQAADLTLPPPEKEPDRQYYFIKKLQQHIAQKEQEKGRKLTCNIKTFGCQMNARDSEKILGILQTIGYEETDSEQADLVLYNTCTVRENANLKVYGRLGQLKRYKSKNPDMLTILCGCMMQEPEVIERIKKSYRNVDIIFGTHNIFKLAELLAMRLFDQDAKRMIIDIWKDTTEIVEELPNSRKYSFKGGVNIMFGCNNFCSYCIVPYVRGRERSREPEDIIEEIKGMVADGVVEVMLLGQNVNSYGKDLEPKVTFAELLRQLNDIDGDFRIRFMTSHPKDCTKELIETMAECDKVAQHLHLPFQSGSNRVLKAMNRHYTREQYLELINYARKLMGDELSITSDIIVGFPGETYEEFQETLSLVKEIKATQLFTFIYSKREGTPAAKMDDPVPAEEKSRWFKELTDLQEKISAEQMSLHQGKTYKCYVYGKGKLADNYIAGRNDGNLIIEFEGDESLIGTFQNIKVIEPLTFVMRGELVKEKQI